MRNVLLQQIAKIVYDAYENLGRAAVFVSQARIGETLAAHDEPLSLERHWHNIEDHPEFGVYWLLCALHRLHQPLPDDVVNAVGQLRVTEVDRNALRHTRDYLVLRDLEHVIDRLRIQFAALGQRHSGAAAAVRRSERHLKHALSSSS